MANPSRITSMCRTGQTQTSERIRSTCLPTSERREKVLEQSAEERLDLLMQENL